jgi:hypothetical protein
LGSRVNAGCTPRQVSGGWGRGAHLAGAIFVLKQQLGGDPRRGGQGGKRSICKMHIDGQACRARSSAGQGAGRVRAGCTLGTARPSAKLTVGGKQGAIEIRVGQHILVARNIYCTKHARQALLGEGRVHAAGRCPRHTCNSTVMTGSVPSLAIGRTVTSKEYRGKTLPRTEAQHAEDQPDAHSASHPSRLFQAYSCALVPVEATNSIAIIFG